MTEIRERRPSIALVTGDFVRTGGMDRANFALAGFLAGVGHMVELVAHCVAQELADLPNVQWHHVAKPLNSFSLGQGFLAAQGRRVGRQVAKGGGRVIVNGGNCHFPDINWVHYVHAAYRPDSALSPARRLKRRLEYPLNVYAERRALNVARIIVCNSFRSQRDIVEKININVEKTRVVYYGNDPNEFYPADPESRQMLRRRLSLPADRPIAAFVGALGDRRKGFDTLFTAWQRLAQSKTWEPVLVVIGAGAELEAWRLRTKEADLDSHIRFLGFRSDVSDILRAADLLVAPTRYEAYGLGVQEALCCGTPAIVSAAAGVAERYPAELGDFLIANVESAAELADRLGFWSSNIDSFRRRCVSLGEMLRGRTWDDMSSEIAHLLDFDPRASEQAQPAASLLQKR